MNIAIRDIYGEVYEKDRCFNPKSCNIGENLLMPGIKLKEHLEKRGHTYHTLDVCNMKKLDVVIFQDIPQSILTIESFKELIAYILKGKLRNDYLLKCILRFPNIKRILIITEPPTVWPISYNAKFYKFFNNILSWNDEYVSKFGLKKYYIPYYLAKYHSDFVDIMHKKFITMICSNKSSLQKNELYSERRKFIDFCERELGDFDLYGFGWENEKLSCYKGTVQNKHDTLSKYKFCICYENISGIQGYVTEKIFDCFVAGCVPIYLGADNISSLIPENLYIDKRKFRTYEVLIDYLRNIGDEEYENYLRNIKSYLYSAQFNNTFGISAYINNIEEIL